MSSAADQPRHLGDGAAAALVFGANAAVLVVELVALRLLAPYLGLTLETSTLVIGMALAAIAFGSWTGGRWADRTDPARVLAPLLAISGVAVAATPFLMRGAGALDPSLLLLVAAATIAVPGALLSAVTPMVTKLRLSSLTETGTIVGRLSGIGTAGAIVGTVITGFVLITRVPVTGIMVGLGIALVAAAAVVAIKIGRDGGRRPLAVGSVVVLLLGAATFVSPSGCDAETTYHCAEIVPDPARPDGRRLVLDGLSHSYVDVRDPTYLEFSYVKAIAAGIDAHAPAAAPLRVHNIGAGGLTVPRYLAHTRPGTSGTVSEIDPGVVQVDREDLALPDDLGFDIRIEDGRVGLRALPEAEADLVIGDAFGGVSVPWHLTTREAMAGVVRALRPDGVYALNIIDYGPLDFVRAEVATLRAVFPHVALASATANTAASRTAGAARGGNFVALASREPIDVSAWEARIRDRQLSWSVLTGDALNGWTGDAPVLTDDHAPVDQLLTPYPTGRPA